jgi:hypothetical protein
MMDEDWKVLMSFFPANWRQLAADTHALKGLRQDKSAEHLLRTLLMHLACGYSLRETVVRARHANVSHLSDVALLKRLRKSQAWLNGLCLALFHERGMPLGPDAGVEFRVVDGTHVKEPGQTGSLWRIHYSLRVPSLTCDFFKVTATEGQGTGESLTQFPINADDYILADRGYASASGIEYVTSKQAFVCVRINPQNVVLQDRRQHAFRFPPHLRQLRTSGAIGVWPVTMIDPKARRVPGRICAIRKTHEAIRLAHKKLRRRASKTGQALRPATLFFAEYVIVFTTFPESHFSPAEVLEGYRLRWQVELVFKRFKQIAQLGHVPKYDDDSAKAWLYGKLFAALVTEKIINYAVSISPWGCFVDQHTPTKSLA